MHDRRWCAALGSLGFDVDARVLPERSPAPSLGDTADAVAVVAGPLHAITRTLLPCPLPVVGLSWGYDLQQGDDLSWLPALAGLIVDTEHNRGVAVAAGVDPSRIVTVPWGIDIASVDSIAPARPDGVPDGARIVISARAHEPVYRVEDIIRAFAAAAVPDTTLVIAHGGTLTPALRDAAAEAGVDAVFTGGLSEEQLVSLLKGADAYVSASEVDGTSVTLLQAMACGTRVVVSDTPGNLEWVAPGRTGWTFPTGDVPALARGIAAALTEPASGVEDRARVEVTERADWAANISRLLVVLPPS